MFSLKWHREANLSIEIYPSASLELVGHVLPKSSRQDGWLESVTDVPFGSIAAHCYVRAEKVNNVKGEQMNCAITE